MTDKTTIKADNDQSISHNRKIPCFECDGIYNCIFADEPDKDLGIIRNVPIFQCPNCSDQVMGMEAFDFIQNVKKNLQRDTLNSKYIAVITPTNKFAGF